MLLAKVAAEGSVIFQHQNRVEFLIEHGLINIQMAQSTANLPAA